MKTNPQINRNVVAGVETLWSLTSNEELWRGDGWVGAWMDGRAAPSRENGIQRMGRA